MKKSIKTVMFTLTAAVIAVFSVGCSGKDSRQEYPEPKDMGNWTVTSPNGNLQSDLRMNDKCKLTYSVNSSDVTVVENSELGFTIKEDDFNLVTIEKAETVRVSGSYENISGKHAKVAYDCNQLTLTLKGWEFYLDVIMRVYDDGYAFRYNIRAIDGGNGTVTVESENSEFALPEGATVWSQPYVSIMPEKGEYFAYENPYTRMSSSSLASQYISMPMLYKVKGTDVYSLITESDLIGSGYYGSFLAETENNYGTGRLKTVHTPAGCAEDDNVISYPFTSPWRVGITGDMKTVVESELVEKVMDDCGYWKPDNYDELSEQEKAIYNYEWVDADVAAWNWLISSQKLGKPQSDWELQREWLDLAYEMGWKYTVLDGGWNPNDTEALTDFTQEAAEKNVKVLVWCNALSDFANGNVNVLRNSLDTWAECGVAGIKIDFFDGQNANNPTHQGEDIDTIKWYETIYQECAKRKMVVNCHGSNKPTGERRRYPNVLNREAVYGNEMLLVDSSITVNSLFVRAVVGSTDFTPVVYPFGRGMTMGHQMALAVLYEGGMPSMADLSTTYKDEVINEYYKSIPALRDDTVFICGELDGYYCAAVRSGDDWFVAGVNSVVESNVEIDFSFLPMGDYTATVFTDIADNSNAITRVTKSITKDSKESVSMIANGGFVYHLKKIK